MIYVLGLAVVLLVVMRRRRKARMRRADVPFIVVDSANGPGLTGQLPGFRGSRGAM